MSSPLTSWYRLRQQRPRGDDGFALLAVLLIVGLITAIIASISQTARVEVKLAGNNLTGIQASAESRSGIAYAKACLDKAKLDPQKVGQTTTNEQGQTSQTGQQTQTGQASSSSASSSASESESDWWSEILKSDDEATISESKAGKFKVTITDESSRLNLNAICALGAQTATSILGTVAGMNSEIAAAIVDWYDADDTTTQGGAEKDWYAAQTPSSVPRNGKFRSVDELLAVKGVTPELFFGPEESEEQGASTQKTSGSSSSIVNQQQELPEGFVPFRDLFTVWSASRNLAPDNQPKIQLSALSSPNTVTQLASRLGINGAQERTRFVNYINTLRQRTYQSFAQLVDNAPENTISRNNKARILDYVATDVAPVIQGKVNVMTAGKAALTAIVGAEAAAKLIEQRDKGQMTTQSIWNIVKSGQGASRMELLTVTTGSFRIESTGMAGTRSLRRKILTVVDKTGTSWQTKYYAGGNS